MVHVIVSFEVLGILWEGVMKSQSWISLSEQDPILLRNFSLKLAIRSKARNLSVF